MSAKSRERLIQCLCSREVLASLVLYLPRLVGEMVWESEVNDVIILGILYDRNLDLFLRLMMLFTQHSSFTKQFLSLIPSPQDLFSRIHLDIPFAFSLIRTILPLENVINQTGDWSIWTPEFETILKSYYPPNTWEILDYPAFLLFWCTQFRDICCPQECYKEYLSQLDSDITVNTTKKRDRNVTRAESRKLTKLINKLKLETELLKKDQNEQQQRVSDLEVFLEYRNSSIDFSEGTFPSFLQGIGQEKLHRRVYSVLFYSSNPLFSNGCPFLRRICALPNSLASPQLQPYSVC